MTKFLFLTSLRPLCIGRFGNGLMLIRGCRDDLVAGGESGGI